MNYREIQKNYPKAYEALLQWIPDSKWNMSIDEEFSLGPYGELFIVHSESSASEFDDRDLYDFFDENRIVIECYSDTLPNAVNFNILVRYVVNRSVWLYKPLGAFESRSDAELAAFDKCFSILETRIENMPTSPPFPLESDLGDAFAWGMP